MKRPRVIMADDHSLILAGLRRLVEADCDVVATVEDGRSLLEAAQRTNPDLVLLDISMPLLNGLDAARQLSKLVPDCRIIFLTMHANPAYATEAFQAGASAYLLKRSAASELPQAIRAALSCARDESDETAAARSMVSISSDKAANRWLKSSCNSLAIRFRSVSWASINFPARDSNSVCCLANRTT